MAVARKEFNNLPDDLIKYILSFCDLEDVMRASQVSRRFKKLTQELPCAIPLGLLLKPNNAVDDVAVDINDEIYVKGTYAQVREFLNERNENQHLLERMEKKSMCCVGRETPAIGKHEAIVGFGGVVGAVAGILWYFLAPDVITSNLLLRWATTVGVSVTTAGVTCGIMQAGYYRDWSVIRNRQQLRQNLNSVPREQNLHGAVLDENPPEQVANPYYVVMKK